MNKSNNLNSTKPSLLPKNQTTKDEVKIPKPPKIYSVLIEKNPKFKSSGSCM